MGPGLGNTTSQPQSHQKPDTRNCHSSQFCFVLFFFYKIKLFPSFLMFPALQFRALAGRRCMGHLHDVLLLLGYLPGLL